MNHEGRLTYRDFGSTGLRPSSIGIGCSRIGNLSRPERDWVTLLRQALDAGINFFDTADIYSQGNSEGVLGEALRGRRQEAIICTKAGHTLGSAQRLPSGVLKVMRKVGRSFGPARRALRAGRQRFKGARFDGTYLTHAIENSLRRLRTDYVDIFLLHNPPLDALTSADLAKVIHSFKDRGLVRYYGVACPDAVTADYIRASLCLPELSVIEMPTHPYVSDLFFDVVDTVKNKGVAIIGRTPYAYGKIFDDKQFLRIVMIDPANRTPAQMALRFAIQLNELGMVLPGVSSLPHLEDTLEGLSAPPLSPDTFDRISALNA